MAAAPVDYNALAKKMGATSSAPADASTPEGSPPTAIPTGEDFLSHLKPEVVPTIKKIAEGKFPFPGGAAMRTPYWQGMLNAVSQYDPSFDAVNFNGRNSTYRDFTAGAAAKNVTSLNMALSHMEKLSDRANELANTRFPMVNSVKNWIETEVGDPRVKKFITDKQAVSDELERLWRGSGGSEGSIKDRMKVLDEAGSPEQLHGAIAELGDLVRGRLEALENQYRQGMGKTADYNVGLLRPEASKVLDKIKTRASGKPAEAPSGPQKGDKQQHQGSDYVFDGKQWVRQ